MKRKNAKVAVDGVGSRASELATTLEQGEAIWVFCVC